MQPADLHKCFSNWIWTGNRITGPNSIAKVLQDNLYDLAITQQLKKKNYF